MSTPPPPPPPPGYGTLPPDPDEPRPPQVPGPMPYGQHLPGGQPYPPAAPYAPAPGGSNTKTLGIISTVAGVIALPTACCCWFISWIPALVAIVCGGIGLSQLKNDPMAADAKPFLVIGTILGVVGIGLTILSLVFGFANAISQY